MSDTANAPRYSVCSAHQTPVADCAACNVSFHELETTPSPVFGHATEVWRELGPHAGLNGISHPDGWTLLDTYDAKAMKADALRFRFWFARGAENPESRLDRWRLKIDAEMEKAKS
jgi:hypothetical protein